jgi:type VI secretion system secreted protein Hcp
MPIYLDYEGIKGDVTEGGHKGWIEVHSLSWGVSRMIDTRAGSAAGREQASPNIGEISVSKETDSSSVHLFMEGTVGTAKKATIHFVKTGTGGQDTFLTFELTNTLVSGYSLSGGGEGRPSESVSINFTKVEMKYTPYDDKHKAGSPIPAGYDITTAKKV